MLTTVPEERFNTLSHLFGGILTILGTIVLIFRADGVQLNILVCLIWGISNATLFISSTVCHSKKLTEDHKSVWTTIDQIAIFGMIAGTYTPITVFYMTGNWLLGILLGQWIFAGAGIILKLIKPNSPRWITAAIYLAQGWMLLPAGKVLFEAVPSFIFGMIIAGGLFYSIGVLFYITKKQMLKPQVFGAHGVWHIMVLLGALSFFIVIFKSV
jgi:hemolysin III